jgi:hypothetical protein
MLQLRNTPDPDCDVSPAQIVFGRPLHDAFSFVNRLDKYSNPNIRPMWHDGWPKKEAALQNCFSRSPSILNEHARPLQLLIVGARVYVQNQRGNHPNRWDRSGFIVKVYDHVKVDGSGRLTKRNRKYLRKFDPASTDILSAPMPTSSQPGVEDTSPVAHPHPAQPKPQVELVMREAPMMIGPSYRFSLQPEITNPNPIPCHVAGFPSHMAKPAPTHP